MIFSFFKKLIAIRDEDRHFQWSGFQIRVKESSNPYLVEILSIRQRARAGTKAYVKFHRGYFAEGQAVWIPEEFPSKGDFVLGSGSEGDGRHHRESVFYFNEVEEIMKAKYYKGYLAHCKRKSLNT